LLLSGGILLMQPASASVKPETSLPAAAAIYMKHDRIKAQKLFEQYCTKCHSAQTALSRRTYQDWRVGVTYRHGKSQDWLPEKDAKEIFLHFIVHLEPELKRLISGKNILIEKSWRILITTVSGILTFILLFLTYLFAHSKHLRKKWFKAHKTLAKATFVIAILHGGLCFYLFVLK